MRLKNVLIVVTDIEVSKKFYQEIFGLQTMTDFGTNVMLTEGLVLQEKEAWKKGTKKEVIFGGNAAELYFEHNDMESFSRKLEHSSYVISYINPLTEDASGRKVVRFYDPDMHVIEVAESLEYLNRK